MGSKGDEWEWHISLISPISGGNKVLEHIAAKYDSVKEGVKAVMGGKVLEYEAKTIKREGIEIGIKQGIEQGTQIGIEQGTQIGIEQGTQIGIAGSVSILKSLGLPPQTILVKIQEQYNLSPESAEKYL